jgi:hypothetical protein
MQLKKHIFLLVLPLLVQTGLWAQPLSSGMGSEKEAMVAKIDSNTLHWRNKLYPLTDAGELNIYGFEVGDIPVYSDSTYAFRLSLLETEIPLEYAQIFGGINKIAAQFIQGAQIFSTPIFTIKFNLSTDS